MIPQCELGPKTSTLVLILSHWVWLSCECFLQKLPQELLCWSQEEVSQDLNNVGAEWVLPLNWHPIVNPLLVKLVNIAQRQSNMNLRTLWTCIQQKNPVLSCSRRESGFRLISICWWGKLGVTGDMSGRLWKDILWKGPRVREGEVTSHWHVLPRKHLFHLPLCAVGSWGGRKERWPCEEDVPRSWSSHSIPLGSVCHLWTGDKNSLPKVFLLWKLKEIMDITCLKTKRSLLVLLGPGEEDRIIKHAFSMSPCLMVPLVHQSP
jgi:hypothetical protein